MILYSIEIHLLYLIDFGPWSNFLRLRKSSKLFGLKFSETVDIFRLMERSSVFIRFVIMFSGTYYIVKNNQQVPEVRMRELV